MAFTASINGLLERVESFVTAHLDKNWVSEPKPARLALLVREELRRWTLSNYPGAICDGAVATSGLRVSGNGASCAGSAVTIVCMAQ